jgi:hypothetical protein
MLTTNQTTIAHVLFERLREEGTHIDFPESLNGDLILEHNWAIFNEDGPKIMSTYEELFNQICLEIDYCVENGYVYFDDDGTIYIQDKYLL